MEKKNGDEAYNQAIEDELSQMSEIKKVDKFFELYTNGIFEPLILDNLENKLGIVDKIIEIDDSRILMNLIEEIGMEFVAEYINKNGKSKDLIMEFLPQKASPQELKSLLQLIENDAEKAVMLLDLEDTEDAEKGALLALVDNEYYRMQIVRNTSSSTRGNYHRDLLLANIRNYDSHREYLENCATEEEKVNYINSLEDLDLRIVFLKEIQSRENRDAVIDGLTCTVAPEIKPQVELVQDMIMSFFEDKLGYKLDDEKRDKLRIAFNKTDVGFENLGNNTNGLANYVMDTIKIHPRHKNNLSKTISFLIHEYGHILSQDQYKTTRTSISKNIDEGAQDLFAELVINHYLEKNGKIELKGKQVRMEYPHISYSGYKNENRWIRTILAPLEEQGTDIEAFAEYQIGDKLKFLELAFGKRELASFEIDDFGNPDVNTNFAQIYRAHKEYFGRVNRDSVYYRINTLLPLFEIQSMIEGKSRENILNGGNYNATYVAELIFGKKKIYEIPRDELEEFQILCYAQSNAVVVEYDNYANSKISELTDKDIDEHSFEVLDSSIALWADLNEAGTTMERVWGRALTREIEMLDSGQDLQTSINKYKRIVPNFIRMLSNASCDSNEYLLDRVKDLQFAYTQQIETAILEGRTSEVVEELTDKETGKMFIDEAISEVFRNNNVSFETISYNNKVYRAEEIIQSAVRANVKFDDIKDIAVLFNKSKGKDGEGIDEVRK